MSTPQATDERNVGDWDACDEHCRSFPRGDACPGCLYDETISLRAECATKALEIERLRNDIQELTCGDPRKVCPNCRRPDGLDDFQRRMRALCTCPPGSTDPKCPLAMPHPWRRGAPDVTPEVPK